MRTFLEKLHPLFLFPAVVVLWLVGSTMFILLLSILNVPGINEFGLGILISIGIWFFAVIGGLWHAFMILRHRGK
jgi:hypothetical protein